MTTETITRNTDKKELLEIPSGVGIGHIHLKVSNLQRSINFYTQALGMTVQQRMGNRAAFLSFDGYHHHLGLNTWESLNGTNPPFGSTGLYHAAFLYPTRYALACALKRLSSLGVYLDGAADHGVSEALYLRDPDNNGLELYWDKPMDQWPKNENGELDMYTQRLDLWNLLNSELEESEADKQ